MTNTQNYKCRLTLYVGIIAGDNFLIPNERNRTLFLVAGCAIGQRIPRTTLDKLCLVKVWKVVSELLEVVLLRARVAQLAAELANWKKRTTTPFFPRFVVMSNTPFAPRLP